MRRFINPNGLQRIPRSYYGVLPNGEKFRIPWDNGIQSWESYYAMLRATLIQNGVTPPSEEETQDFMCRQAAVGCTGDPPDFTPTYQTQKPGGCSSCGKQF